MEVKSPNWLQFPPSGRRKARGNRGKRTLFSKVKVLSLLSRFQVILAATSDLKNKMALTPFLMVNVLCWSHQSGSATVAYALFRQPGLPCWCSHSRFIKEQVAPMGVWMALWRSLLVNIIYACRWNSLILDFIWANAKTNIWMYMLKFSCMNQSNTI